MNVGIGTEAPQFLFWEYLYLIFGILSLQCGGWEGVMLAGGDCEGNWKEWGGCTTVPYTNKGRNFPHPVKDVGSNGVGGGEVTKHTLYMKEYITWRSPGMICPRAEAPRAAHTE